MKAAKSKLIVLIVGLGFVVSALLVTGLWFRGVSRPQAGTNAGPGVTLIVETLPPPPEVTFEVIPLTSTPDPSPEESPAASEAALQLNPTAEELAYNYLYQVMDRYGEGTRPRLLESYDDAAGIDENDIAWTYDNALVVLALLARGQEEDLTRAKVLVDALVYAQAHDPAFSDGRLRDAYPAHNLIQTGGTVRVTSPGSATGNMAWAMLALLGYWERQGGSAYLEAAERLGQWIYDNTYDERGAGGYSGGYDGGGAAYRWKATEHNADVYTAFMRLYEASGDLIWLERALHAKGFLQTMWNEMEGHFWTGTTLDGASVNPSPIPEDAQSWSLLALGEPERYGRGLAWTLDHLAVTSCPNSDDEPLSGVRFSDVGQNCWFEGSAHTALALQMLADTSQAETLHRSMHQAQARYSQGSGGLVAASPGGSVTGYGFAYPHTPHIAATAWLLFVERGYNPFWSIDVKAPVPYAGFEVAGPETSPSSDFQKGLSYAGWQQGAYIGPAADQALTDLAATGVEWLALIVTCYQETYLDTAITCDLPRTPTDADLVHAIQTAHRLGLKVMLKPHIDLNSDPDHWRGDIGWGFTTEAEWEAWFDSYQAVIDHYAALAQTHNVEQFSVGTELVGTSRRDAEWRQLITGVRSLYTGPLVYASNHSGEEQQITWWDALDYIGVDAYYPLTTVNDPTLADLKAAWERPIAILETLHHRYDKPIILTEIGYRSVDGANRQPWDWAKSGAVDLQEQADSYHAVLDSLWARPWLAGIYWWNWDPNPAWGGPNDPGYTPHDKPAEAILRAFYQPEIP